MDDKTGHCRAAEIDEDIARLAANSVIAAGVDVADLPVPASPEFRQWLVAQSVPCALEELSAVASQLQSWAKLVVLEAECTATIAYGSEQAMQVAGRALALIPVADSVRFLRRVGVERDLLTPARAKDFAKAVRALAVARAAYRKARAAYPRNRVKGTVNSLDLDREISALRDSGGWLPWDHKTSDAALDRVRPHFRPKHRGRSRHDLAKDLALVRAFKCAERDLDDAERVHRATLGSQYASRDAKKWMAPKAAVALRKVVAHLATGAASPSDLDAVWTLEQHVAADKGWWDALTELARVHPRRRAIEDALGAPLLANFPSAALVGLARDQHQTWVRLVTAHAGPFRRLLCEPSFAEELSRQVSLAATPVRQLHDAFQVCRANQQTHHDVASAVAAAVKDSATVFGVVDNQLRAALVRARPTDAKALVVWDREVEKIRAALNRRAAAMTAFRVVLFGRTGAGKSSFVEALTRGNGCTISTGEGDFTKLSRPVVWGSCTLVDTPGIEGWGNESNSADLEAEAREALDTADLVVLAFDTQNQKAGEFEKVARWVLDYDKPVVVLLNQRNGEWRRQDKATDSASRRSIALNLSDHAQHIQDALASYGLIDAAPIAIHTLNAVAARCPNYAGPYADGINALRERVGAEQLEHYSNFAVVERLLIEVLGKSALDVRLQSLANDVRQRIRHLVHALTESADAADSAAAAIESRIDRVLRIVGPGASSDDENLDRQWRRGSIFPSPDGLDSLTRLEEKRQRAFATDTLYGQLWEAWDNHCAVHLDICELRQTRELEERLRDAFAHGEKLASEDIQKLYDDAAGDLTKATDDALSAVHEYLTDELEALARRVTADGASASARATAGLDGSRGTTLRNFSRALTAASTGLMFVPIPGVNVLVSAGVRMVGQILLSIFSRRSREAGERDRAAEFRQALTTARNVLLTLRGALERQADREIRRWAVEIASTLVDDVTAALAAHATSSAARQAVADLNALLAAMPDQGAGTAGLAAARERILASTAPDSRRQSVAWRHVALGEDWLDHTRGGTTNEGPEAPASLPNILTEPFVALDDWLRRRPAPAVDDAVRWLQVLGDHANLEVRAAAAFEPERTGPSVALTGPTRVGVTALRRAVATGHSTEPRVFLRDGSQQNVALSAADAIGLVLPPSLFGAGEDLQSYLGPAVLQGDTKRRLFLVLTRIDELAIDPAHAPDQLTEAVSRKLAEVRRFVARSGLPADLPVVPVAAPPWASSAAVRPWWSGADRLAEALDRGMEDSAGLTARTRYAIATLATVREVSTTKLDAEARPAHRKAEARLRSLSTAHARGEQLQVRLPAELKRALERVVMPLAYDVAGARNRAELVSAQRDIDEWRRRPEVTQIVQEFEATAVPRVRDWLTGVGRTVEVPTGGVPTDERKRPSSSPSGSQQAPTVIRQVAQGAEKTVRALGEHSQYYKLGKDLGYKFKPWEAVKGAQRMRNVTPALSRLTIVLVAVEVWNTERAEKRRNTLRAEAPEAARNDISDFVTTYMAGLSEDKPGFGRIIANAMGELGRDLEAAAKAVTQTSQQCEQLQHELDAVEDLLQQGLALLEPGDGVDSDA